MNDVIYRLADGSPAVRPDHEPSSDELAYKYAGVLQHAHELLLTNNKLTFGQALQRAVEASDLPPPPPEVERGILVVLTQLFANHGGGFPTDIEA